MTKRRSLPLEDQSPLSDEGTNDVLVGRILISGAWAQSVRDAETASNDNGRPQTTDATDTASPHADVEHLLYAARKRS